MVVNIAIRQSLSQFNWCQNFRALTKHFCWLWLQKKESVTTSPGHLLYASFFFFFVLDKGFLVTDNDSC